QRRRAPCRIEARGLDAATPDVDLRRIDVAAHEQVARRLGRYEYSIALPVRPSHVVMHEIAEAGGSAEDPCVLGEVGMKTADHAKVETPCHPHSGQADRSGRRVVDQLD